jgi:hypothetical protein
MKIVKPSIVSSFLEDINALNLINVGEGYTFFLVYLLKHGYNGQINIK